MHRRSTDHRAALLLALTVLAMVVASACVTRTTEREEGRLDPDQAATTTSSPEPGSGAGNAAERAIAREVFVRVNDERAERGMAPLRWNHELTRLGRSWSEHLAAIGHLEHRDINELLGSEGLEEFAALGENIFRSTGPVPAGEIHVGWMRSDGHRRNVLQPGFNVIGIGVVCAPDGEVYATQEFGRTRGADRPELSEDLPPEQPIVRAEPTGPSCSD